MKRTFQKLLDIAKRTVRILFYSTLALVWLLILLYLGAAIWTGVLMRQSGQLSWANLPNAVGQALRPAFLATTITTWQTALLGGALYLLAIVLAIKLTARLFSTADRVKQYVNPGEGPVLLSDVWFEPEAQPASPQRKWWFPWRRTPEPASTQPLVAQPPAAQDDPLDYNEVADKIANTIMRSANEAPFAIAIEGRWGIGKTSLMKMIEKRLKGDQNNIHFELKVSDEKTKWRNFTIWFNPWRHRRWDAQKAFMSAVFAEIPWRALSWYVSPLMRRRMLSQLANIASFIRGRNGMSASITNQFDVNALYRNRFQSDFEGFLQYWAHAEGDTHINLIVFIDDLDRCAPSDIGPILESMKLFFESKNCIFVLGFDPSIVARSIQRESHGMIPDGLVYLQKIIQAEYRLPQPPDAKLLSLLNGYQTKSHLQHEFDIIDQQLRTDPAVPSDYQERILKSTHRTPRQMKRLINELALKLPQIKEEDYASVFTWALFQFRWPEPYATFIEATEKKPTKEVVLRLRHAANVPPDRVEQGAADAVVSADVGV